MSNLKPSLNCPLLASTLAGAAALLVAIATSGCHATIGTPDAIREYHRGLNGMITEGKTSPDVESAYWRTQKQHDGLRLGGNN